jgi:hypothetical protein
MKKVSVQVAAAVPKVVKRNKIDPEFPIQDQAERDRRPENDNFGDTPLGVDRIFPFDLGINCFGIFAEIAEENVTPRIFCLAIVSVTIDGDPVLAIAVFVRPVTVSHVVPVVDIFIKCLGDPERHGQHDAVQPVQYSRRKVRVMNVIVRDPVHIPRHADRVDESQADKEPPRGKREDEKQDKDVRAVK